jgi:hypothetical protein
MVSLIDDYAGEILTVELMFSIAFVVLAQYSPAPLQTIAAYHRQLE